MNNSRLTRAQYCRSLHSLKNALLLTLSIISLCACQLQTAETSTADSAKTSLAVEEKPSEEKMPQTEQKNPLTTITGTIVYKQLEGGFWALTTKTGQHYTLKNLPKTYRQHGLMVKITGQAMTEVMTITQFGTLFNVTEVIVVNSDNVTIPSTH